MHLHGGCCSPLLGGCILRGDLHSSTADASFGSWRYFRWSSRASFVSKHWLLTGDLNLPPTLMPTFSIVPSPGFAASVISILPSLDMVCCNSPVCFARCQSL